MNKDELQGGARYIGGKVEKTLGDVGEIRDWQVDGVVDQVAGGVQHAYGRAKSIVGDVVDSAPELADEARDRLTSAADRATDVAQHGGKVAVDTLREEPAVWVLAAGVVGYALAWLIHGRR
ncbi:uncharacterized protein YjbJ (UPF0337 family) [Novosphingobium chloroacetimidivorans]|uniref:Uncharacterized protein YjbJ (UPF0337 family) n=1 Tax=Novosphingobium chloroacetimidivorans TaxID=1428314 RepID=A0A7W7NYU4_9SPHN|nr:CsbD family protein [Novosphingobium chloroacetimidivorans]MBB4860914.1 uncharacterized protein YjbJ (UPF0337 family) [Novosphingobium chloroacetimidivorans]